MTEPTHAGAICHRRRQDGTREYLLIRTSGGKRWIIPKGGREPGELMWETALREVREEAGWLGEISPDPLGEFNYTRRRSLPARVAVFLVEATTAVEPDECREQRWVPLDEALSMLRFGRGSARAAPLVSLVEFADELITTKWVPRYQGQQHCDVRLPATTRPWPLPNDRCRHTSLDYDAPLVSMRTKIGDLPFVWPLRTMYLVCQLSGDTGALRRSLIASGGVRWTGPSDHDFELTSEGRQAKFLIAGDTFGSHLSNLRLLRMLGALIDAGADLEVLASDRDLQILASLTRLSAGELEAAHLDMRNSQELSSLLDEVQREELDPDARERTRSFMPRASLPADAPTPPARWSRAQLQRTSRMATQLFVAPQGEFVWYLARMKLVRRWGSFLVTRTHLDRETMALLAKTGTKGVNAHLRRMFAKNPLKLLSRSSETPQSGLELAKGMHRAGLYGVIGGHSGQHGQRIFVRQALLDMQSACAIDQRTRRDIGLEGAGAAVTIFRPEGVALGVSADYPHVKVFDASRVFSTLTLVP